MVGDLSRQYPKLVSGQAVGGAALVMMLRKLVESINNNKAINIQSAWDGVQHNACASVMEELKQARVIELRKIAAGEPLPAPVRQPIPVRDEVLAQALKEGRRSLRAAYR